MPLRPILLAPLAVGLWYLVVATVGFAMNPRADELWVYWIVALFTAAGYVVFTPISVLLLLLVRPIRRPALGLCVLAGAAVAFLVTFVPEWPNPNFMRWRYYAFAVVAGILWAVTFWFLVGRQPNRPLERAGYAGRSTPAR